MNCAKYRYFTEWKTSSHRVLCFHLLKVLMLRKKKEVEEKRGNYVYACGFFFK